MSTETTNYKFHKPSLSDPADITKMNKNWDDIDTNLFNSTKSVVTYYNSDYGNNVADTALNTTMLVALSQSNNTELFTALGSKDDFAYIQQYFFGEISEAAQRVQVAQGRTSGNISVRSKYSNGTWSKWSKVYSNNNPPTANDLPVIPVEKGGTGATSTSNARKNLSVNLLTFINLSQIGLTEGEETIAGIVNAMPGYSQLIINIGANNANIYPDNYGLLKVEKIDTSRTAFEFRLKSTTEIYVGFYDDSATVKWTGWSKVVTDMDYTSGTIDLEDGVSPLETGKLYFYYER